MNAKALLTQRENQVAELLAWGAAKKEVADRLDISTRTVENEARSIYAKIGIQKATELCVFWFCARYKVSFDLDPLKRNVITAFLLIIILPHELTPSNSFYRIRTKVGREVRTELRSTKQGRKSEEDYIYN